MEIGQLRCLGKMFMVRSQVMAQEMVQILYKRGLWHATLCGCHGPNSQNDSHLNKLLPAVTSSLM